MMRMRELPQVFSWNWEMMIQLKTVKSELTCTSDLPSPSNRSRAPTSHCSCDSRCRTQLPGSHPFPKKYPRESHCTKNS